MSPTETNKRDWVALEQKYYQGTFKRIPITLAHGEGTHVWDTNENVYLDLVAGIAVNVLGHCHPAIIKAVQEQVTQLVHTSNLYYNTRQIELAEQLGLQSKGMRSFFSNSGAEANEGAIKLARKYGLTKRNGAYEIISVNGSFHGRTMATTAATGQPAYQATWKPLPEGFQQVAFNDLDAIKKATTAKTAAILVEAVQGEGGIWPTSMEYMRGLRQWCDEQNLVLICDEVQAGMGRTGTFFSWEYYGIRPDITTMAKGLAGGVPIGAMLTDPRTDLFTFGEHGTTFGGNPIACAAGIATIKTINELNLLENARAMGEYWHNKLTELCEKYPSLIDSPRGRGLMRAVHVQNELGSTLVQAALDHGLLLNSTAPDTLRMLPPLIVSTNDLDEAADKFEKTLATVANQ